MPDLMTNKRWLHECQSPEERMIANELLKGHSRSTSSHLPEYLSKAGSRRRPCTSLNPDHPEGGRKAVSRVDNQLLDEPPKLARETPVAFTFSTTTRSTMLAGPLP
ncbi:predicted protein [Coccidioides posadasii str. Silveira]|uniref:Predicted protein n=1 Tax=Coccidioides posadasii (strain RMSCC 757 / Silveira) TaxID=443226 RepID=E9D286_COCPS|nr:predicted protein [Coccidioides posadasii str. Silveira]